MEIYFWGFGVFPGEGNSLARIIFSKMIALISLNTGNRFTECILSDTQQTSSLSNAAKNTFGKIMALDKQTLCRVLKKNTQQTKKKHLAK